MGTIYRAIIIFSLFLVGACASRPDLNPSADFSPVQPQPAEKNHVVTGAIFDNGIGLFGNLRSYQPVGMQVGDLVTVLLSETTQASRTAAIKTSRETSNNAIGDTQRDAIAGKITSELGFGETFFSDMKTDGATITSDGSGVTGQAASLTGSISAMVIEVLANGNLVIVGEKQLALTEGSEFIRIKGIIRPADIQPDNTVLSRRIANAQISYRGTGNLAKASKPSWGTGLLFRLWPF